jgi:hypothetical protein
MMRHQITERKEKHCWVGIKKKKKQTKYLEKGKKERINTHSDKTNKH